MAIAYSYLRFSSAVQASGDSVRRQTEATAAWCARNKVTLDTTVKMRDEGVSAYRGKNRENGDTHALAGFLTLVEGGKIERGAYLIVESLDRLSREKIRPALTLLLRLIGAGVRVVQLTPVEAIYDDQVEPMQLMLAIMELSRGHSESAVKSERVGAVWREKQRKAGERPVTRRTPGWIVATGGAGKKMKDTAQGEVTFSLDPVKTEVVRRIFRMTIDGHGQKDIATIFNAEGVPVFGRARAWTNTLVGQVLTSRATVGEYVPYTHKNKARPPKGEAVPNYFPAAIDETTFRKAAAGTKRRGDVGRGRRGAHVNLFSGLLKDAKDGGPISYWHTGLRPATLIPYRSKEGSGGPWVSFPAEAFEAAVLTKLAEVRAEDVFGVPTTDPGTADLEKQIAEVDALVAGWTAKMDDLAIVSVVATKLSELTGKRAALKAELDRARGEAAAPVGDAWGEFRSLAGVVAKGDDATRLRVRAALRRTIERIDCLFIHYHKAHKGAGVQVRFTGGLQPRLYVLSHRRNRGTHILTALCGAATPALATPEGRAMVEKAIAGMERYGEVAK